MKNVIQPVGGEMLTFKLGDVGLHFLYIHGKLPSMWPKVDECSRRE